MEDDLFSRLNDIFDKWLSIERNQKYIDELSDIILLVRLVFDNTPNLDSVREFKEHIDINDSINLVIEFFNSINPEYAYRTQNIINGEKNIYGDKEDYSVKFCSIPKSNKNNRKSGVNFDGRVRIDYDNTIADAFSITHEMTHKLSAPYNQCNLFKFFLQETSSLEMEFVLYDYLKYNEIYKEDVIYRIIDNFINAYNFSCYVLFECTLLKLYFENDNYISKEIFMDYLSSMDKSSKLFKTFIKIAPKYLLSIDEGKGLHFHIFQRYVIGLVLACDFHKRLKNDKDTLSEMFKLIDILGKGNAREEDLRTLSEFIPIIEKDRFRFDVSDEVLERLTETYKSEIFDILKIKDSLVSDKKL